MLRVHKRRQAAGLLRLGNDLQRNRRLARRLRPEDLNHPPARHAAHASAASNEIDPVEITAIGTTASF
jgi:hypothetical protein